MVVVIDNLSNSTIASFYEFLSSNCDLAELSRMRQHLSLRQVDIRNGNEVDRVFKKERKVDVCIHLAAKISVAESLADPDSTFATNVRGTKNVLTSASQTGTLGFVFVSSAAVYGLPKRLPILEEDPTEPISPYGKSKLIGEQLVWLNFETLQKSKSSS